MSDKLKAEKRLEVLKKDLFSDLTMEELEEAAFFGISKKIEWRYLGIKAESVATTSGWTIAAYFILTLSGLIAVFSSDLIYFSEFLTGKQRLLIYASAIAGLAIIFFFNTFRWKPKKSKAKLFQLLMKAFSANENGFEIIKTILRQHEGEKVLEEFGGWLIGGEGKCAKS